MRRRDQAGFTLLELLIAISIMGFVFGIIATAFVLGYETSEQSERRLAGSQDAELLSIYLLRDIQSADTATTSGSPTCGITSGALLTLSWKQDTATRRATYRTQVGADGLEVTRQACRDATTSPARVVARQLLQPPTVACTPSPCSRPTSIDVHLRAVSTDMFRITGSPRRKL